MKALVYTGPKTLSYQDEPDPQLNSGETLVRIEAVGICGSDMHAYLGHDERRPAPLILGHEACGLVVEGGLAGKRVAINPLVSCGICSDCHGGRANLCADRQIISMPPRPGAFAEYIAIPESNLVEVPGDLNPAIAALTEPVATGLHAVLLAHRFSARPLSEGRALVLGGGAVGLAAALVLASHGCKNIQIADTNSGRRKTAEATGVCKAFDPLNDAGVEPGSIDVVIDAVGAKATRIAAIQAARPGSVIVHVGLLDGADGVDMRRLTLQEITLVGCYTYTMVDFQAALSALYTGALGISNWFEERPLSEGISAFDDLQNGRSNAAKIVLRP
ncbi:MAG: alcohol dehydrogenase catalytic domain-containing protein [bacterium]|nr:alcohol dehydrogenase catalytic domain-containing protein [bacterium]